MASESVDDRTPDFIYGTAWKEEQTYDLTKLALESGFRAVDTANQRKHYHEVGVGEAIQDVLNGTIDRSDLFVQTKFTYPAGQDHRFPYDEDASNETKVRQSLNSSLEHLGLQRVDSYILHGPSTRRGLAAADREVWRTMEQLAEGDKVDQIGVSNVSPEQLDSFIEFAEKPPAYVQNRCFAREGWDSRTREICSSNGIRYQAFSLLTANQRELQADKLRDIARRYKKTVPQIAFRFAMEKDMIPLTGTTSEEHMKQDLACRKFDLKTEDVNEIEQIGV
ncbi:MAG: aldo/keto reductase family protein [bacterium]